MGYEENTMWNGKSKMYGIRNCIMSQGIQEWIK